MRIRNSKSIAEIQDEFRKLFPGLKIEFYKTEHGVEEGSRKRDQYDFTRKLGDIRNKDNEGDLVINPAMTVAELEAQFKDIYDLHVQIFRRSGTLWLQTTRTDDWTLEVQNRKGIHSLEAINEE